MQNVDIEILNREMRMHIAALGAQSFRVQALQRFANEGQVDSSGRVIDARGHFKKALVLNVDEILAMAKDLRRRNVKRADIIIAIDDATPSAVLLDDVTDAQLNSITQAVSPLAIVRTSQGSMQCWVAVPRGADALQFSRGLARTFGADLGAVGAHQFGKLCGFQNRKPTRLLPDGKNGPWVRLLAHNLNARAIDDRIAAQILEASLRDSHRPIAAMQMAKRPNAAPGESSRVDTSASGQDFARACRMLEKGETFDEVVAAIEASSYARGKRPGYAQATAVAAQRRVALRRKVSGR